MRSADLLAGVAREPLAHLPTPLEPLPNLSRELGCELWIKRDDCTGLAMGGNKARQLEFYLGDARRQGADTIVITGAVQSNYVRMAAAAARKRAMDIHIQLEQRVPGQGADYYQSGNVLLDRLFGATLHEFATGEDEVAADANLEAIAETLRAEGRNPYVVHLGAAHPPRGALGYVKAAGELLEEQYAQSRRIKHIVVPSGSSHTHAGLLFGLRALGSNIPVTGICVRREASLQAPRVLASSDGIASLLNRDNPVVENDVRVNDAVLAPGYGLFGDDVREAIEVLARSEGILVDPVYTGKTLAGLLHLVRTKEISEGPVLFMHTGGTPALFAYKDQLTR